MSKGVHPLKRASDASNGTTSPTNAKFYKITSFPTFERIRYSPGKKLRIFEILFPLATCKLKHAAHRRRLQNRIADTARVSRFQNDTFVTS